ncbi:class I SAM-dependent methyltransferase [Dactylosporangium sp. CA-233914]|uniref:class I SAM-dependent methyltransferase n=1 Tax=Dactylosporangium sp. CA-233914 TaxID=3239934 RepID=UPI003D8FDCA8
MPSRPTVRRRSRATTVTTPSGNAEFRVDPAARDRLVDRLVADALRNGGTPTPDRSSEGYVRTPQDLADELCNVPYTDLRFLPAGARVLEPSAGDGALVAAILRANPRVRVVAIEPNPVRAAVCAADHPGPDSPVELHQSTFEQYAATAATQHTLFDAIVMNPPFALPDSPNLWFEHLRQAWHLLRRGGWLVAVVPASLAYRGDTLHRDARLFIDHHGSHEPLPADAFAESGSDFACRVVRLTKPMRTDAPEYLLTVPQQPPVPVDTPQFTAAAAVSMPVQVRYDSWTGRDRILRYQGRCAQCRWLLWGFDDGDNDPRGVLGPFSAGLSLDPGECGLAGPEIGLCPGCASTGERYRSAYRRARQHWSTPKP